MKDRAIMEAIRARDQAGLQALMERYRPLLQYVVSPILSDEREREECLSDVYWSVWNHAASFDETRGTLTAWLTAMARNAALNRVRGLKHREYPLEEHTPSPEEDPEAGVLRRERQQELLRAVAGLDREQQLLFYRKYYYCQPTEQIARELGLSCRGVEGRLYRLRKKLRQALKGGLWDEGDGI